MTVRPNWITEAVDVIDEALANGSGTIYTNHPERIKLFVAALIRKNPEAVRSGRITVQLNPEDARTFFVPTPISPEVAG